MAIKKPYESWRDLRGLSITFRSTLGDDPPFSADAILISRRLFRPRFTATAVSSGWREDKCNRRVINFFFLMCRHTYKIRPLFRETVPFSIAAFDFATFEIDIKGPQRSRRLTHCDRLTLSPPPFLSISLCLLWILEITRWGMKRNATANASPFILPPGTFLAVGIPAPAALRLRENEAFRFNSGIPVAMKLIYFNAQLLTRSLRSFVER